MITLITGLPGNGKTLFALWYIKAKADKENREVYYHNIKDLNPEVLGRWSEFKAEDWFNLPDGSIVVMDEAQFVFSKKPNGSKLPEYYEKLAVHRHKGLDIFVITQHPTLLDNFVRQLVGQHFHSIRKFGLARSTIYEWSAANPAPQNPSSHKNAVTFKWKYPKEVYGWYKSAEVHTVKREIPLKLILALLFIVTVPVIGWFALRSYQTRYEKPKDAPLQAAPAVSGASALSTGVTSPVGTVSNVRSSGVDDPVRDIRDYVWRETPRVAGLPQTAPKYDQLTVPTRVPIPAACIQVGSLQDKKGLRCKCYTQQGTPMAVEMSMCLEFARNGFFQDFDADRDKASMARAEAGQAVLANRPDAPLPEHGSFGGPVVAVIPDLPDAPVRQVRSSGVNSLSR